VTWDLTVTPPPDAFTPTGVRPDIAGAVRQASGGALAVVNRQLVPLNGVGVPTFSVGPAGAPEAAPISFKLVTGRAPRTADEAVIGPATARDVRVKIGDTVRIGDPPIPVTIVGEALFPSDVHAEFDEGVWLTPGRLDELVPPDGSSHGQAIAIRLPPGAGMEHARAALGAALPAGTDVSAAEVPVELENLRNVRTLPVVLAAFLALLAIGALSHVLVASARRRRHDFAILRAIGLDRRRTRLVLNSQGTAIGLVGLVVGVPLGVALGRTLWRLISQQVPLADVPPLALVAVVLIVPVTVAVANALAVWPGHRLARRHPAEDLRAD
jgi:predicted lysophospholipase L1 biosynthesis ABC-type transport system permease subunit